MIFFVNRPDIVLPSGALGYVDPVQYPRTRRPHSDLCVQGLDWQATMAYLCVQPPFVILTQTAW